MPYGESQAFRCSVQTRLARERLLVPGLAARAQLCCRGPDSQPPVEEARLTVGEHDIRAGPGQGQPTRVQRCLSDVGLHSQSAAELAKQLRNALAAAGQLLCDRELVALIIIACVSYC